MRKIIISLIFAVVLNGCANPINQRTAHNYYNSGDEALAQGNLNHAKEMFSRALINVRLGHMGPEAEGQVLLKLARTQGNLCEYEEAEINFLEAISLYSEEYGESSPLTFPARLEIGQFSYDIGRYKKAVSYLEKAFEVSGEKLKEAAPSTYYEVLKDYGDALLKSGNIKKASEVRNEVEINSKLMAKESTYVRYPAKCE